MRANSRPSQTASRRRFLAAGAATGAVALAGGHTSVSRAIEPIVRSGRQRLRLSLSAYSLRDELRKPAGEAGAMDMLGFARYAATLPLDAIEATSYFFPEPLKPAALTSLKRECQLLGLDISGGAIANNFTFPPGKQLDEQFAHVERWLDHYLLLGAPVIRVFAGKPPQGMSEQQAIRNCIPNLERACEAAGKRGIMLAIENHSFTRQVDLLLEIVRGVKSPWFGVNLDSGNFHSADPYADLVKIAPFAVNAQIKVEMSPADRPTEPADLTRIVRILADADYRGYLVLEYEASQKPTEAIPKYITALRAAIDALQ